MNSFVGAAALGLALLAGCAQKEEEPEPVPQQAAAAPRPQIDFEKVLGVARSRVSGVVCAAMPVALQPGDDLTLVTVPIAPSRPDSTSSEYSSVVAARIVSSGGEKECGVDAIGHGLRLPGDSLYTVSIVRDTARLGTVYFAVALPFNWFFRAGHAAGARISESGDVLSFRICTSGEGLHLTAWDGKTLSGKRVWHRYYYLGYDTTPSCVEKDYT